MSHISSYRKFWDQNVIFHDHAKSEANLFFIDMFYSNDDSVLKIVCEPTTYNKKINCIVSLNICHVFLVFRIAIVSYSTVRRHTYTYRTFSIPLSRLSNGIIGIYN